jgi:hypothetical protein
MHHAVVQAPEHALSPEAPAQGLPLAALRECLDAVYAALGAPAAAGVGVGPAPSPALTLAVTCPKLAIAIHRQPAPRPQPSRPGVSGRNPDPPAAAAPREALELALHGLEGGLRMPGARGAEARAAAEADVTVAALRVDLTGGAGSAGLAPCPDPGTGPASEREPRGGAAGARHAGGGAAGARGGGWLGARGAQGLMHSPADVEEEGGAAGMGAETAQPPYFLAVAWRSSSGARHPHGPSWCRGPARAGPGSGRGEPSPWLPPLPNEVRVAVAPVAARLAAADVARLVGFWRALDGVTASAAALTHAAGQPPMRSAVARVAGCSGRRRLLSEPDAAPLQVQACNPPFACQILPHMTKRVMVLCDTTSYFS